MDSVHSNKELIAAVMQSFKGHVRPMLRHAAASSIIEYAYNDKALLAQRLMLTEELYGNTFTICKVHTPVMTSWGFDFLTPSQWRSNYAKHDRLNISVPVCAVVGV